MHVLFVSGGSVGHLAPAIAVWRALARLRPDADAEFVCATREDERALLKAEGLRAIPLPVPRRSITLPFALVRNLIRSFELLSQLRPDVVFSKGGALSVPVCIAARLRGIPVVLHESDAVMGNANAFIALLAKTICLGMDGEHAARPRRVTTGNPVRSEVLGGDRDRGRLRCGLSGNKPVLLVMGGSQGAAVLNAWVEKHLSDLLTVCDIIHITGRGKESSTMSAGYWSTDFVTKDLCDLYAAADLAVSRAGAGSIAELSATGVPSVLVPIAGLAHDHQVKNAAQAERCGFAVTPQDEMQGHLFPLVTSLLADAGKRSEMSVRMRSCYRADAALQIAKEVLQCVAETGRGA